MTWKQKLARVGCKTYAEYLRSECWEGFKRRYREAGLPLLCRVCGCEGVSLHHVTYDRVGEERLEDVTPLCKAHHASVHALLSESRRKVEQTEWAIATLRGEGPEAPPLTPKQWAAARWKEVNQRCRTDVEFRTLLIQARASCSRKGAREKFELSVCTMNQDEAGLRRLVKRFGTPAQQRARLEQRKRKRKAKKRRRKQSGQT